MKKSKIILCCVIALCLTMTVFAVCTMSKYYKANKLYSYIENEQTSKALELISKTQNVDSYTLPLWTDKPLRILSMGDYGVEIPLVEACRNGNHKIVEALLKSGADPNRFLEDGFSPIEATAVSRSKERIKIAKLLISYGAQVDLFGSGASALFVECEYLKFSNSQKERDMALEMILLLLENGASAVNDEGESVLHYLAQAGETEALQKVYSNQRELLDFQTENGQTALIWAVEGNSFEGVSCLISLGVDVSVKDKIGKTAYDYAIEKGNKEIIDLFHETQGDGSLS